MPAANMFIYYRSRTNKRIQFRGPDFVLVWGRPLEPMRRYCTVWKEDDHYPDVIFELGSPTTLKVDKGKKKSIYEKKFRTHEYFIYDPDKKKLFGWRLEEVVSMRALA